MAVATLPNRRKIIDINGNTFRALSIMAANQGTNLKKFIEDILNHVADNYDDNQMYRWLSENRPDGSIRASEAEKKDFENFSSIL